jgi:2,3-bisphosphoglycerate-independent phosphoglycerate mutase
VPCIIYDPECQGEYLNTTGEGGLQEGGLQEGGLLEGLGISSIAATCIELLGYVPPEDYDKPVLLMNH